MRFDPRQAFQAQIQRCVGRKLTQASKAEVSAAVAITSPVASAGSDRFSAQSLLQQLDGAQQRRGLGVADVEQPMGHWGVAGWDQADRSLDQRWRFLQASITPSTMSSMK